MNCGMIAQKYKDVNNTGHCMDFNYAQPQGRQRDDKILNKSKE